MKNQQVERKRITQLVSTVLTAILFSSMLWAAEEPAKPGSHSPAASTEKAENRQAFYVRYARGQRDAVRQAVENAGGRVTHQLASVSTDAVLLPEAAAQALSTRAGVELVEPVPEHRLAGQTVPYNIDQYQARDIWDADRDGIVDANAPDGSNVKFCIIDSGLYAAHDDFVGVTMDGYSQVSGEAWSEDGNGHGTHVAGTANAVHNDIGVVGTMPGGAEFFIVKVFDNSGSWTINSNLGDAAIACQEAGANVISMSLGGGSSATEEAIFQDLYDNHGIVNIAAAGNSDGPEPDPYTAPSYPANYDSVIAVAAIDSAEVAAPFTQHPDTSHDPNSPPANVEWDVAELSGGGVNVLSTWPGSPDYPDGSVPLYQVTVNGVTYQGTYMDESGLGDVTGSLVDGGLCDAGDINPNWSGAVVLCQRGTISFADKINNVRDGGGLGAVIYNNTAGDLLGTCGGACTTPLIPAIGITQADGQELVSVALGDSANLIADDGTSCTDCTGGYNAISGTSMATPGVAAAVALTWDACGGPTGLTNKQIRQLLRDSAKDLSGTHPDTGLVYGSGWDRVTGWGLVQLNDARELGNQLYGSTCPIGLQASPATLEVCGATDDSVQSTITLDDAFEGSATMSTSPLPTGASESFSPDPVVHPTKDTVLTLSGLSSVASGSYDIEATATDDADSSNTATAYLTLDLDAAPPAQTTLQSPADASTGVSLEPTLSWDAVNDSSEYRIDIATDSGFSSIVHTATVTGTSYDLPISLNGGTNYYWRVTAVNACGDGVVSSTFSFTTESVVQVCSTPNLTIPDGDPAGVSDSLSVTASEDIFDVNVYLRGTHTWVGDLVFSLTHPDDSTQDIVVDQPGVPATTFGCEVDDFDLWLDDEGTDGPVEDQCGGSPPALFGNPTPNEALSVFDGLASDGTWTLNAADVAGDFSGTLAEWCLEISYGTAATYTLSYTAGPNGSISGTSPQTIAHGSDGTSVEAVPDTGYHFVQWSDGSPANPRTDTSVTSDITVEAQFAINTYTLTYNADANGTITGTTPQMVDHGSDGTSVEAVPDANYHFVQWSDGSPANPRTDTNVRADVAVEAEFEINTYTVTFINHDSTVLDTQSVDHGSAATAPADPTREGYTFIGWDQPFDNVTGDVTVTAQYEINSYTLTYSAGANGSIIGTSPQTVDHGSDGTSVEAVPDAGYFFSQWSDGSTENPRTDTGVTSDVTVEAEFLNISIFSDRFSTAGE